MRTTNDSKLIAFQFEKFAAVYFQLQNSAYHTRKPLRAALLPHDSDLDRAVSEQISDLPFECRLVDSVLDEASKPINLSKVALLSSDLQAALAIWLVIQRFMGDTPEPRRTSHSPQDFENVCSLID